MADNSADRLNSWKEIANYLGKDTRTAIRWEERGLPVHRVPGGKRQAIFAYRHEIDAWLNSDRAGENGLLPATAAPQRGAWLFAGRRGVLALSALVPLALLAVIFFMLRPKPVAGAVQLRGVRQLTNDGLAKMGLVTDGSTLYFGERLNAQIRLAAVSTQGGPVVLVENSPAGEPLDISPDGTRVLALGTDGLEEQKPLWVVPIHGAARRVGEVRTSSAAFSPSGHNIAFADGNSIFETNEKGDAPRVLQSFDGIPAKLRWSARGLRLLVCSGKQNPCAPWELPLNGFGKPGSAQPIPLSVPDCCGGWSATEAGEYFVVEGEHSSDSVWMAREPAGSGPVAATQLTTRLGHTGSIASHNGTVFIGTSGAIRSDLLRYDPVTHSLAPFVLAPSANYVDFTADGKRVAYTQPVGQAMSLRANQQRAALGQELWTSAADGSNPRRLFSAEDVELPRWSPDGTSIAFTAQRLGRPFRVFVIPANGGEAKEVSVGNENQGAPTWSPDGRFLIFGDVHCEEVHSCAIHRVELANGRIETLPESSGLRTARWSPDGRYAAALDFVQHQVKLFDFATRRWRALGGDINGDDLNWSRDSKFVYAERRFGANPAIVRLTISTGRMETVFDLNSLNKLAGWLQTWFTVAPDGSVIIARSFDAWEIYALEVEKK